MLSALQRKEKELRSCVIYVRVSDLGKEDDGLSPDVQRDIALKEAEKRNITVLEDPYIDLNRTGTNVNRPGLQEMLARCKKGDVDAVIVQDTSRLSRNTEEYLALKAMLLSEGVRIISPNQPTASRNDPYSGFADEVIAASNALHPRITSFKVKLVMDNKFEFGWWPSCAPLGYKNIKNKTPTCRFDNKIIAVDEETGPLIKLAFKKYATGNYSIFRLRKLLHKKGLRTKTEKPISHSTLHQVLTNPFYYGEMTRNGVTKTGRHKKLVTKKLFDICQQMARKNGNYATRNRKYKFLLRGFLTCGECKEQWTAQWRRNINSKKRDKIAYYRCQKRKTCHQSYIETNDLENQVQEVLAGIKFTKGFTSKMTVQVMKYLKQIEKERNRKKRAINNKKQALVVKRSRLEDSYLESEISADSFNRIQARIDKEINDLNTQLISEEQYHKIDFDLLKQVMKLTRDIPKTYNEVPDYIKEKYLAFFFESIVVKDKKIEKINYSPLINELKFRQEVILSDNRLPLVDMFINQEIQWDFSLQNIETVHQTTNKPQSFVKYIE